MPCSVHVLLCFSSLRCVLLVLLLLPIFFFFFFFFFFSFFLFFFCRAVPTYSYFYVYRADKLVAALVFFLLCFLINGSSLLATYVPNEYASWL